jgi:hypothetical protein
MVKYRLPAAGGIAWVHPSHLWGRINWFQDVEQASDSVEDIRLPREGAHNVEITQTLEGDYVGPEYILHIITIMSHRNVVQQVCNVHGMNLVYILRYQAMKRGWYFKTT